MHSYLPLMPLKKSIMGYEKTWSYLQKKSDSGVPERCAFSLVKKLRKFEGWEKDKSVGSYCFSVLFKFFQ